MKEFHQLLHKLSIALVVSAAILLSGPGWTQDEAHTAAVKEALKAAYAVSDSTNHCPLVDHDFLGWPAQYVHRCEYTQGKLKAVAYLLDIPAATTARWIETSCSAQLPDAPQCFNTLLSCGRDNSGMMFAVSGNIVENMKKEPFKNYFFRNGMTVKIGGEANGTISQIPLERQNVLATMEDNKISFIKSGMTRYWRTKPEDFRKTFPAEKVPDNLETPQARQAWLDLVKREMLSAINGPDNRLLDAWLASNKDLLKEGTCPE
jgi:hypothetical protein